LQRGESLDSLYTEDNDPPIQFNLDFFEKHTFKLFDPSAAARTRFTLKGKATEVFELIYRISRNKASDKPIISDTDWKINFNVKQTTDKDKESKGESDI